MRGVSCEPYPPWPEALTPSAGTRVVIAMTPPSASGPHSADCAPRNSSTCATLSAPNVSSRASLPAAGSRTEEHTSELQSLMRISYAVFCLTTQNNQQQRNINTNEETDNEARNTIRDITQHVHT